jgi:2-succinyl-5-enolpyruvyl-6-hydroxy-3-cyclohexene-1-carboxylate synthase
MIDGPRGISESEEYFVTRQKLTAVHLCEEFGIEYLKPGHKRKLKNLLEDFFQFDGKPKVLEIETDMNLNKTIFDSLKQTMKKSYEL